MGESSPRLWGGTWCLVLVLAVLDLGSRLQEEVGRSATPCLNRIQTHVEDGAVGGYVRAVKRRVVVIL